MIPRLLIYVAFAFLAIPSVGQNSQQSAARSFNSIYDSLIINNEFLVFDSPDTLPARDSLVYDPWKYYESKDLKQILDANKYTGSQKINFIKAAIRDTSKDIFSTIETEVIDFWHTNVQAQLLMFNYFIKLAGGHSDDPKIQSRYFNFVTSNALPGTAELIEAYVQNRPFVKKPYPEEIKLVHRLIRAGSEKSALGFLQLLVTEYPGDKGPDYSWGDRREDAHVFDLLCFSNNITIRAAAIQLLWTCLDKELNDGLFTLGSYLDEKRATGCLQKWFQYYTTVDLGRIDSADLIKFHYRVNKPFGVSSYFHFMWYYSRRLGNAMGKQLLAEVVNRMPYWDFYEGSLKYSYHISIIEEFFKDSSVTKNERRQMLFDLKIGGFNFKDLNQRILLDHWAPRVYNDLMELYLKLVRQAYPDGNMGKDDSARLYLYNIKTPYHYKQTWSNSYINMAAAVSDLNRLGLATLQLQPALPDYWTFKWTLAPFNSYILPFLRETGLVSHFDPPYRSSDPVSNKKLFSLYFEPLLANKGITDLDVQEITVSIPGKSLKKVFVRSKEGVYVREYVAAEYGQDQVHKLAKMINLLLMKKNSKERLVEIEGDDYTVDYGVFEPEKLKVFLDKNSVISYELGKVSVLMSNGH